MGRAHASGLIPLPRPKQLAAWRRPDEAAGRRIADAWFAVVREADCVGLGLSPRGHAGIRSLRQRRRPFGSNQAELSDKQQDQNRKKGRDPARAPYQPGARLADFRARPVHYLLSSDAPSFRDAILP